jgi:Zn-dependent protease
MTLKQKKVLKWIGLALASFAAIVLLSMVFISRNIFIGAWFALVIMTSVGLHEYGHILAGKYLGVRTAGFYFLPFFGGASFIEMPDKQWSKFIRAYGGPLMGLCVGVLLAIILLAIKFNVLSLGALSQNALAILFASAITINSVINLFNLIPVYPIDGGQILAAIHVNNKNKFEKYLPYISWIFIIATLIYMKAWIMAIIVVIFYKRIGKLESFYYAEEPFRGKDIFFGWVLYLGLIAAHAACFLVPYFI